MPEDRDRRSGRFVRGNQAARGHRRAKPSVAAKVASLRRALIERVSEETIQSIVDVLVDEAKGGNVIAAREVLDRCLGRPLELDLLAEIERLRSALGLDEDDDEEAEECYEGNGSAHSSRNSREKHGNEE